MNPRLRKRLIIAAVVIGGFLWINVDNWGRDFIRSQAAISEDSGDPRLKPVASTEFNTEQLALAVEMSARRIRNWRFTGRVSDDRTVLLQFVRTHRLLRIKDDITMRVEDQGHRRVVRGESKARLPLGDLGRNPRNLARILAELRSVLEGSARRPSLQPPGSVLGQNR